VIQHAEHLLRSRRCNAQRDTRILFPERRKRLTEKPAGQRIRRGEPHETAHLAVIPELLHQFIFQLHKTARKQQHLTSLVCQRDRVVDTFKQHAAEFLLELADLERNRRLGIPLYLRGLCKTAEFRGQHKSFQAFIIHIFTINFANVLFLIYTLPRIFSRNQ